MPQSAEQWKLVRDHLHLIPQAIRRHERRGLSGWVDVESLAMESLYKAAANFDPARGTLPALFRAILRQAILDRVRTKCARAIRRVDDMPESRDSDPAREVVAHEERALVERVVGGRFALGNRHREANYADLVELGGRLGLAVRGVCKGVLLGMVVGAIQSRLVPIAT
jgi:DNA-directed RNA polymerase specialized sigma24 family protein